MQTDLITLDKMWVKKVINFFKNPITSLGFAVLLSTFFYFISLSYKKPSYYLSEPELVAKKTDENLKIYYKDKELTNLYSTYLILWNDGNNFIDYDDFIKDKPIKLYSNDSVRLLSASLIDKSRMDLNFTSIIKKDTVCISLTQEEAIEEGDGAKFLILYTINDTITNVPTFNLESRIKGTKEGFTYKDLSNYKTKNDKFSIYLLWIIVIFLISFRIIILLIYKKPIVFRQVEAVFII